MEFELIRRMGVIVTEVDAQLPKAAAYIDDLNLVVFRSDLTHQEREECADRLLVEVCRGPRTRSTR